MGRAICRTALESSSRGCATIISNRGGLPETTNQAIILKTLDDENLYKQIRYLIKMIKLEIKFKRTLTMCSTLSQQTQKLLIN